MKCPTCQTTLLIADKKGVEIDYCPDCRGIWLDSEELEKILERSAEHYSSRSNYDSDYKKYQYGQDNDYHENQPQRKKKSFLDDIFDF
ncbi:MAG: zf-TFIIB domain-containing protein [Pedobacter sp.]|jgi:hypothetical protein